MQATGQTELVSRIHTGAGLAHRFCKGYIFSELMSIRHIHVIINPIAGACKQAGVLRLLLSRLRAEGITVEALTTKAAGEAWRMAAGAPGRADAVVAVGGGLGVVWGRRRGLARARDPPRPRGPHGWGPAWCHSSRR